MCETEREKTRERESVSLMLPLLFNLLSTATDRLTQPDNSSFSQLDAYSDFLKPFNIFQHVLLQTWDIKYRK